MNPLARSLYKFLTVLICLSFLNGCVFFLPTPSFEFQVQTDNLVVIESSKRANLTRAGGAVRICREFYRYYEDVFDLIVLIYDSYPDLDFSSWGSPHVYGRHLKVRHKENGTGQEHVDIGNHFGSKSTLRGVVQLKDAFGIVQGALLHEIMHLWVGTQEIIPTVSDGHWGFSSVDGILGGFKEELLIERGGGQYTAGDFSPYGGHFGVSPYSELEMYLAGWIPPEEVPDIWVAEDGMWLSEASSSSSRPEGCGLFDVDCVVQTDSDGNKIFFANEISTWTIEQIIAKIGPRKPDYLQSQKEFRVAFVYVTPNGNKVSDEDLEHTSYLIEEFTAEHSLTERFSFNDSDGNLLELKNFWEATLGKATLKSDGLHSVQR